MATKGMTLVGLDVHARQTHAAVLDPATGEIGVSRLRMAPLEVVAFLERLGRRVRAVYETGPTGFAGLTLAVPGDLSPTERARRPREGTCPRQRG